MSMRYRNHTYPHMQAYNKHRKAAKRKSILEKLQKILKIVSRPVMQLNAGLQSVQTPDSKIWEENADASTFVYFCKSKHGKSYQKHQGQQKIKGHTTRKSIKNTYINNELKVLRGRV